MSDQYTQMLALLNAEIEFFETKEDQIKNEMTKLEAEEASLGVQAKSTLDHAQKNHIKAQ